MCIMLVKNMLLVLQKSKQAKTKGDLKGKIVRPKKRIVSLSDIPILDAWIVTSVSHLIIRTANFVQPE